MTTATDTAYPIVSIHVGRPRAMDAGDDPGKPWTSGIIKDRVDGPIRVGRENLDGDGQADLVHHGGVDKAVLAYPAVHFPFWKQEFPDVHWGDGTFGENLTIAEADETKVCIGDVFEIGDCVLQVSQPRQPCWKLSRRWRLPKLAVRVQQTRRTGWYFRVLSTGTIRPGQSMHLTRRDYPDFTVAFANDVMFAKPRDAALDLRLAACDALSVSWKKTLNTRSGGSESDHQSSVDARLRGDS
ncbi:MOSC domain-containing protein [Crateriforma conspicua]|uniref:6-N-hydroxylaminopurine resistance protein n=1 Tax=Crateriforma conspicua TaxID=2527996 RepID=A0A5C5Y2F6_9PLAN|nr:MOSC domain-containing protein [Crateriforma conspicua]TWT68415.1 6-N-hydroxylaminopurine resistance protein [Crateriforma conspicua]